MLLLWTPVAHNFSNLLRDNGQASMAARLPLQNLICL